MNNRSLSEELERLAQLRQRGHLSETEFQQAKGRLLVSGRRGVRRRSKTLIAGWPLWEIAVGPDPARGEWRGHARAFFALGDLATGFLAIGGLARGVFAFGGLAVGLFSVGGAAIGLAVAFGGAAAGSVAIGGAAVGHTAIGGGAAGVYALGGGAAGQHVISADHCDYEAVRYFGEQFSWLPGSNELTLTCQGLRRSAGRRP